MNISRELLTLAIIMIAVALVAVVLVQSGSTGLPILQSTGGQTSQRVNWGGDTFFEPGDSSCIHNSYTGSVDCVDETGMPVPFECGMLFQVHGYAKEEGCSAQSEQATCTSAKDKAFTKAYGSVPNCILSSPEAAQRLWKRVTIGIQFARQVPAARLCTATNI